MAISLASVSRTRPDRPPIALIHGGPGVGKTTFASHAEDALFILVEDGLGDLEVNTFKNEDGTNRVARSYDEVMEMIAAAFEGVGHYRWLVLDSLSALEPLIWDKVARAEDKLQIEDLGFGKGYINALKYWRELFVALEALSVRCKIGSLLIAHSDIVRFESPDTAAYDRTQIKLHKRAFQLVYEKCDVIGYAAQKVFLKSDGKGDRERKLAISGGDRMLYLAERPAFIAKNRYRMPDEMPFEWGRFSAALPSIEFAASANNASAANDEAEAETAA